MKKWSPIISGLVKNTCYIASKCYLSRYGIANYYLNVNWRKYIKNLNDDYVVPRPQY